jgi:hypothetical protein
MHIKHRLGATLIAGLTLIPAAAAAQEPEARQDSLEQIVRVLTTRLDSLERLLDSLMGSGSDTAQVVDEIAALRAAARAVVPEQPPDTTPEQHVIRSRSLSRLNPEISVTGDARLNARRPGPQEDNVDLREFSFGFQSALDPYSNAKVFFSFGEDGVGVEEAYAYWTGVPGGLRLDIGRFRQQAGELNRWHLHAMPESEYPLVIRRYFGDEGLRGDGLGLYWMSPFVSPGGGVHELWLQAVLGTNDVLFENGNRVSLLGHLNNFWQINRSTYMQLGMTALYGENPDSSLATGVAGIDLRLTWRPPEKALYRSFTLRGEAFGVRKRIAGTGDTRFGGYIGATYQASRRIHLGGRFDYVELLAIPDESEWAIVPQVTWWQSEWVFLRAEWQHTSLPTLDNGRETTDRFVIQVVWSIGPHKHWNY